MRMLSMVFTLGMTALLVSNQSVPRAFAQEKD